MWRRLQHPNIVPFLGILAEEPTFAIFCDWMENGKITEYVSQHPEVDRLGLVSKFVLLSPLCSNPSIIAVGRGGGPSPLAFVQHSTWRPEGREWFFFLPFTSFSCQTLIPVNQGECSNRQGWTRPPYRLRPDIHRSRESICCQPPGH